MTNKTIKHCDSCQMNESKDRLVISWQPDSWFTEYDGKLCDDCRLYADANQSSIWRTKQLAAFSKKINDND